MFCSWAIDLGSQRNWFLNSRQPRNLNGHSLLPRELQVARKRVLMDFVKWRLSKVLHYKKEESRSQGLSQLILFRRHRKTPAAVFETFDFYCKKLWLRFGAQPEITPTTEPRSVLKLVVFELRQVRLNRLEIVFRR